MHSRMHIVELLGSGLRRNAFRLARFKWTRIFKITGVLSGHRDASLVGADVTLVALALSGTETAAAQVVAPATFV